MPLFDFKCSECGAVIERIVDGDTIVLCGTCNKEMKKLISKFNFRIEGFNEKNRYGLKEGK